MTDRYYHWLATLQTRDNGIVMLACLAAMIAVTFVMLPRLSPPLAKIYLWLVGGTFLATLIAVMLKG